VTHALVQAFISCRLDYCNSLLAGVTDVYLQRLHFVQNAAARLVSGARRHDHIAPALVNLHWIPVRQQIIYKMVVLVWKCLHDAALTIWLTSVCRPIPCVVTSNYVPRRLGLCWSCAPGQRSFAVIGPQT